MIRILGISAFYHDSAASLIVDGKIIHAVQEERFTRKKNDSKFPTMAINYILNVEKIYLSEIDFIVFYDKPFLKFERLIYTIIGTTPFGLKFFLKSLPVWLKEKLFLKNNIYKELKNIDQKFDLKKIIFCEHHLSHLSSAFFPSPFKKAIILTIDGVGEWATTSVAIGNGNSIDIKKEIHYPHSLGLLYSAFTYYIGFKVNSGEYKLMGLSPYGKPIYMKVILENLIHLKEDGSFRLNQDYFNYNKGLTMINSKFESLFGSKARIPDKEKIRKFHMNIASSIQSVMELIVLKICKSLKKEYNIENLCLAGGVALNCVINGKILNTNLFKNIWIQPASGDSGGSLGAALAKYYLELNKPRKEELNDSMKGSLLGPSFTETEIESQLSEINADFRKYPIEKIIEITAKSISKGKFVGWFQGRMEFGPRSLGNRAILADPRFSDTQKNLNLKIKFRESFRPFAPSILVENLNDFFNLKCESPYMLLVDKVISSKRKSNLVINTKGLSEINNIRSSIPAVTHVDYSSRIQTVDKFRNPIFYNLINEFKKITGIPILVNTSFNIRGEPIVLSPVDAYNCFINNGLDLLIIGNFVLDKKDQNINNTSIGKLLN